MGLEPTYPVAAHILHPWAVIKKPLGNLPCGAVIKTPCFQCRGHVFNSWLGN